MSKTDIFLCGALVVFAVFSLPFICEHVEETWDAPEYPHSGFYPGCEDAAPMSDGVRAAELAEYQMRKGGER